MVIKNKMKNRGNSFVLVLSPNTMAGIGFAWKWEWFSFGSGSW